MNKPLFLFCIHILLYLSGKAQTTKNPANSNTKPAAKPVAKPAVVAQSGCYNYYPVKAGSVYKYFTTTFTVNNPEMAIFEITYSYYPAASRKIDGILHRSLLKDEDIQPLMLPDQNGFSLYLRQPHRTDRVYYECETTTINGKTAQTLSEYQEILQEHSKITGYYTQVTEEFKSWSSMIPQNVTYEDLPITEIERLGTGKFNRRVLYTSTRNNSTYEASNQEIRLDRSQHGGENKYEYRQTIFGGTEPEYEVLGKSYKNVICLLDYVYKSSKGGKPEQKELISYEENYYALGVGLITRFRIEKPIQQNFHQMVYKNLLGKKDNSEVITIWELEPAGFNARQAVEYESSSYSAKKLNAIKELIKETFH